MPHKYQHILQVTSKSEYVFLQKSYLICRILEETIHFCTTENTVHVLLHTTTTTTTTTIITLSLQAQNLPFQQIRPCTAFTITGPDQTHAFRLIFSSFFFDFFVCLV